MCGKIIIFSVKSTFLQKKSQKLLSLPFCHLWMLIFGDFCHFLTWNSFSKNRNFRVPKNAKTALLELLHPQKSISRKIWMADKWWIFLIVHTATADPRKVYFKVVTEPKEAYQFQKVYYFPDWNSSKPTLLVFWALRYRAVKLTKYWDFCSSKLANFQKVIKWSIFDIFWKFLDLSNRKKSRFLEFSPILKITCKFVSDLLSFLRPFLAKS